jgi:hypothetical protein
MLCVDLSEQQRKVRSKKERSLQEYIKLRPRYSLLPPHGVVPSVKSTRRSQGREYFPRGSVYAFHWPFAVRGVIQ